MMVDQKFHLLYNSSIVNNKDSHEHSHYSK